MNPALPLDTGSARWGISVTSVLLGTYLLMKTDAFFLISSIGFRSQDDPALLIMLLADALFATLVLLIGLAVAPATVARRAIVVGLAGFVILIGVLVAAVSFASVFPIPGPGGLIIRSALLPSLSAPFLATIGWLLVRGRPPVTLLFALLFATLPSLNVALVFAGVDASVFSLVSVPIAAFFGIGIAWAAAALDRVRLRPLPAAAL